jgi:deoxyribodipyrimidine photo-lyase
MASVLLWFRNDLRLSDHAALAAAAAAGPVVPVFILDETAAGDRAPGGAARWWLHHSLAALDDALRRRGSGLVLRRGRAETVLPRLAGEAGATAVFAGAAVEPWARAQQARVAGTLPLHLARTGSLFAPDAIRTGAGKSYAVFTAFARACLAAGAPAPASGPRRIAAPATLPRSDALGDWRLLPRQPDWAGGLRETWRPGEAGAGARLAAFRRSALGRYDRGRNLTGEDGTSMLSPHLHFGELSAAQVWHAAATTADGKAVETFLRELLWREFSLHLLWHHPHLPEQPLRPAFARMAWRRDARALRAWRRGETGVPMVDAAMRQLWHTGWMHNRARMIVASFLAKHLLIPWQEGERWFWDTLVDADLASNSANWQWIAGSGVDAAPYFRIFNPVLQGEKFDPDGAYVRRWLPELARLPDRHLHAPWAAPAGVLDAAGVRLGETYPRPIVDLAAGRERALAAYRAAGQAAE